MSEATNQDVQDMKKLLRKAEFDLKIVNLNLDEGIEVNVDKQRRDLEKMRDKLVIDIAEVKELIKRATDTKEVKK